MSNSSVTLDNVLALVQQLSPDDQARLIAHMTQYQESEAPLEELYGLWANGEQMPSEEEIRAVRHKMWADFGDEEHL